MAIRKGIRREDIEGIINIEADITPVTRTPIEKVDSTNWHEQSVGELQSQLNTLRQRRYAIAGNPAMVIALDRGIAQLTLIIDSKSTTTDETRLL